MTFRPFYGWPGRPDSPPPPDAPPETVTTIDQTVEEIRSEEIWVTLLLMHEELIRIRELLEKSDG